MSHFILKKTFFSWLAFILSAAGVAYLGYEYYDLAQEKAVVEKELADTRKELASTKRDLIGVIRQTEAERDDFSQKLNDERGRVDSLALQIKDVTGSVDTLVKISKTDAELLKKYSKVYFLNENYVPAKLSPIDSAFVSDIRKTLLMLERVLPFLQDMMQTASSSGVDIRVVSAYRSFGEQTGLKYSYKVVYGAGTANRFSAEQGYSEHQLGTTADFTTAKLGANLNTFEKNEAYKWLTDNAYKYGFILSYPKNNAYYQFEPWHWRFVGLALAEKLRSDNKYFYDLDQRIINSYLALFFDEIP